MMFKAPVVTALDALPMDNLFFFFLSLLYSNTTSVYMYFCTLVSNGKLDKNLNTLTQLTFRYSQWIEKKKISIPVCIEAFRSE